MNRLRTRLVTAGALVLALTNAVVLVGVASNRRPPPDSMLTLTERELGPQLSWMGRERENSGLSLRLRYRTESAPTSREPGNGEENAFPRYGSFGPIVWLDRDKLAALGFDVSMPPTVPAMDRQSVRMLGRDVLLVLDLDGPVYARALQAARNHLALEERDIASNPEREGNAQRLQRAQSALQIEEHQASRLFIVDAGLDQATLRQRYADRTHYAIVHGNIRPYVTQDGSAAKWYGMVTAVRCETINVPLQFRASVPLDRPTNGMAMNPTVLGSKDPFTLQVEFGSRLEPWIVSAHAGST